jgi:hypothetical protein
MSTFTGSVGPNETVPATAQLVRAEVDVDGDRATSSGIPAANLLGAHSHRGSKGPTQGEEASRSFATPNRRSGPTDRRRARSRAGSPPATARRGQDPRGVLSVRRCDGEAKTGAMPWPPAPSPGRRSRRLVDDAGARDSTRRRSRRRGGRALLRRHDARDPGRQDLLRTAGGHCQGGAGPTASAECEVGIDARVGQSESDGASETQCEGDPWEARMPAARTSYFSSATKGRTNLRSTLAGGGPALPPTWSRAQVSCPPFPAVGDSTKIPCTSVG